MYFSYVFKLYLTPLQDFFDCRLSLVRHSFHSFVEAPTGRLNDRQPPDLGGWRCQWWH